MKDVSKLEDQITDLLSIKTAIHNKSRNPSNSISLDQTKKDRIFTKPQITTVSNSAKIIKNPDQEMT